LVHGRRIDHLALRGLNRDWADHQELTMRPALAQHRTGRYDTATRKAAWQNVIAHGDYELAEVYQGFEQIYGITCRDPTAYRPLMEFCWGIPTEQYMRDGTDRWLARRMAKGRLPEEQRQLRDHGISGADTYHRIRRIRHELRAKIEGMEADPDMAAMLDLPALAALLDDMPISPPPGDYADLPHTIGIPLAFSAAYMIAHAKGRNDF
jgi:asparagine synthase (glutamine-hydrolysing)